MRNSTGSRECSSPTQGERRAGTGCRLTIMQGQNSATEMGFCRNEHILSIPLSCHSTGNTPSYCDGFPCRFLWSALPEPALIPFLHKLPFPTSSQHIHSFSIVLNSNNTLISQSLVLHCTKCGLFVLNIKWLIKYKVQPIYHLNNPLVWFQPVAI